MVAVTSSGEPLPWYTYPCIDFLSQRDYSDKTILEFGGGQSTLWWAKRAKRIVTLEGDEAWYHSIKSKMPENVDIRHIRVESADVCVEHVNSILESLDVSGFDVIVIDGHFRAEMIPIARRVMTEDGMIVCDNAEGYGFFEGFQDSELNRVDFAGQVPGVIGMHDTSIYFPNNSFAFRPTQPIPLRVQP